MTLVSWYKFLYLYVSTFYNNINLLIHTRITLTTYRLTLPDPQPSYSYAFGKSSAAIPITINIGNAM